MAHLIGRSLRLSGIALALLFGACASSQPAGDVVGLAKPAGFERFPWGIPDWVRVIHADPFAADRKSFGPGEIIPVVVKPKSPSKGELFTITYSTNSPTHPASAIFESLPTSYVTTSDEPAQAFAFSLRVKPAASLPANPITVNVILVGVEDGTAARVPSNDFIVKR